METLNAVMERMKEITGVDIPVKPMTEEEYTRYKCESYNNSTGKLNEQDGLDCTSCKNRGYTAEAREHNGAWYEVHCECTCMKTRRAMSRLMKSGLKNIIKDFTFKNYEASEPWQQHIKSKAVEYCKNPNNAWFFIGGQSGCVDADTEYFDGKQWRRIADYQGGKVLQYDPETKKATLTDPERYIAVPATEMYQIRTSRGSINQVLSENHNFAYLTSKKNMRKKPFREVMKLHKENVQGFYGRIETTFNYSCTGIDLTDNEIRLMCAVIADGSFKSPTSRCIVNVKKQRKKDRMKMLLENAGCEYKEYKKSNGYSAFKFYAPRREKDFSDYWYNCNARQLRIITEEVFHWDGSIDERGSRSFYTTVKRSADFVQFALSATGTRATISEDNHKEKPCYIVIASKGGSTVSMVSTGGRKKAEITKFEPKDGKQYCFTVETGYLVLRRGGRVFITGNSGKTHICTAIAAQFLRTGKNVRYMLWRDDVNRIKGNITDAEKYNELMQTFKEAEVLYIDDLFKNGRGADGKVQPPTAADIQTAFEILNYRANNKHLITIISSERKIIDLVDIDEAVGGRISEMSFGNGYGFNINPDRAKNYRIKNLTEL